MSLMLPGWLPRAHRGRRTSTSSNSSQLSAKEALEIKRKTSPQMETPQVVEEVDKSKIYLSHWELSRAVTTQHLLSVISVGNTLMGMNNASFVMLSHSRRPKPKRSRVKGLEDEVDGGDDDLSDLTPEQASIKQGWSLLAALHCVLLPDMLGSVSYKPPYLEMLARRWQDRCLERVNIVRVIDVREDYMFWGKGWVGGSE
ncbi:putative WD repeat-containing protein 7 isoform X3 [Apostichopus japonicus]|uniref:Putative WD repeat-containing protein 7 isoform X3 n=1 Tax=Stichopus japonicus TaxID=307972 RepID=A0A2G8LPI5_STIJA|nr:putative WD repeat-containing protein 7 isoform X3 [Apostichopus japonicus]